MNFDIHIGARSADASFPVHVVAPAGEEYATLMLPERLMTRAAGLLQPGVQLPTTDEPALGVFLAERLFTAPLRKLLAESVARCRAAGDSLRLALRIDAPELAALPWEWLTIGGRAPWSPARLEDYGLVRVVAAVNSPRPIRIGDDSPARERAALSGFWPARSGGKRLLLVAADAMDETLRAVTTALDALRRESDLGFAVALPASLSELRQELRRYKPHVLHMIAPVAFSAPGEPLLTLGPDETSPRRMASADGLARLIGPGAQREHEPAPPLLLFDGNWSNADRLNGAAPRLAMDLAAQAATTAIAFHSPLYPAESALFAQAFYRGLVAGQAPGEACAAARQALAEGGAEAVWGMPMLAVSDEHWRVSDGPIPASIDTGSPRRARRTPRRTSHAVPLVVPLLAAGAGIAVAVSVFGWPDSRDSAQQAASSVPVPTSAVIPPASPFAITLPTPTFAPPIPTPSPPPTIAAATVAPTAPPASPEAPPASGPVIAWVPYLVRPGDTVTSVAARLGSDPQDLAALNHIDINDELVIERGLIVPVYRPGEAGVSGIDVRVGRQDRPAVALTFDTEINDVMLYQILEILQQRGARATFFVTGNWVRRYPDAARAIVASGHEIGNHSLTHPAFTKIGADGAVSELQRTEEIVEATVGVTTRPFFRFPYGAKDQSLINLVGSQGYLSYHWTVDDNGISAWLQAVAAGRSQPNGAILLMHQRPATITALPGWLDQLAALGLEAVPLSRVLQ